MQLLFKDMFIGYINHLYQEGFWIHGSFERGAEFQKYRDFFKALVCEDGFDETEFEDELFDDTNWKINDNGVLTGIYIPAIYEDGEISFRCRE